jgi:hypothetical protein
MAVAEMTEYPDREDLLSLADALAAAVRQHALQLYGAPDDAPATMSAVTALRQAALAYGDACFRETRWGNPLARLTEVEPGIEGEDRKVRKARRGAEVVVEARYRLKVHNAQAAADVLRSRAPSGSSYCVDSFDNIGDLVTAMFRLDGWDPSQYDQSVVELIDEEWSCSPQ